MPKPGVRTGSTRGRRAAYCAAIICLVAILAGSAVLQHPLREEWHLFRYRIADEDQAKARALSALVDLGSRRGIPLAVSFLAEHEPSKDAAGIDVRIALRRLVLVPEGSATLLRSLRKVGRTSLEEDRGCSGDWPEIIMVAAQILEDAGPRGMPALLAEVRDPRGFALLPLEVIEELGKEAVEALPALNELLLDPSREFRSCAASALARMGAAVREVLPTVISCCDDEDLAVRGWCLEILTELAPETARPIVTRILRDSRDWYTRAMAEGCLEVIEGRSKTLRKPLRRGPLRG